MSIVRPVLIVKAQDASRNLLVNHLVGSGEFWPVEAADLLEAFQLLNAADARFDAVFLDVQLPDGDGIDFCADLRWQGHRMPIIILGKPSIEADVIRGLAVGANDFISNPARLHEVLARLRALLRVFDNSVHAVFTIGSYTFRPSAKLLVNATNNYRISLTNKEVDLLKFLYQSGGGLVTRQILLSEVWGYSLDTPSTTLETHIYALRRKLAADPANCNPLLIAALGGYRLAAVG